MCKGKYTYEYPRPSVTSDCVIFGYDAKGLSVLLIERGQDPFKGCWAFPGGFMQMDEDAETCARRELEEETGYKAGKCEFLLSIRTTVAFCNERIDIFLAEDLVKGEQELDEDEYVDIVEYSLDELLAMIDEGKIQDSKTICALLAYYRRLNSKMI